MTRNVGERLVRARTPRAHIRYEVDAEGPMVETRPAYGIGALSELCGSPAPLAARRFIRIDVDNGDNVLDGLALQLDPVPDAD